MNRNDNENKLLLIEKLLKESFWNDYTYTAELIQKAIEEKNKPVIIHFIERIIAGAYFSRRYDRVIFNITGMERQ